MRRQSELPEDLERLGHHLEAAVTVAVRRHSRRQAVMSFVGAVVIAVPFALAGAATSLSPGLNAVSRPAQTVAPVATVAPEPPSSGFIVRRALPVSSASPWASQPCLDEACRLPENQIRPPRLGRY
jgi:hypothetical protein